MTIRSVHWIWSCIHFQSESGYKQLENGFAKDINCYMTNFFVSSSNQLSKQNLEISVKLKN